MHFFGSFPHNSTLFYFPLAISKAKCSNYHNCQVTERVNGVKNYRIAVLSEVVLMSAKKS